MRVIVILFCVMYVALSAGEAMGPCKKARAVRLDVPVAIDGHLDEPGWKSVPVFSGFERLLTDPSQAVIPPEQQTSFQIGFDDANLYIGVRCNEPEMEKLHPYGVPGQWDAAMWVHDDVELFFDPVGDRREMYQFAIDPNGAQCDLYFFEGGKTPKPYSSAWRVRTFKGPNFWSAEIVIPFSALYQRPAATWSDEWIFSIARSRMGGDRKGFANSVFSPTNRGYHDLVNFGTLAGVAPDRSRYVLFPDRPILRVEPNSEGFRLLAQFSISNSSDAEFRGSVTLDVLADGARGGTRSLSIPGHGVAVINVDDAQIRQEGLFPVVIRAMDTSGRQALVARWDESLRYTPLIIRLASPNYHNSIFASQRIDTITGSVFLGMPIDQVRDCALKITLGAGPESARHAEYPILGQEVPFALPSSHLTEGTHTLAAELLRPSDGAAPVSIAVAALTLRKLAIAPDVEVRIDDQANLLINGSPIMLRGWYTGPAYGCSSASLPRANLPHSTNFLMGRNRDGIWCLAEVCRLIDEDVARLNQPLDEGIKSRLREVVASVRGQRNVIGYYLADEPSYRAVPAEYLRRIYEFLVNEDPYRLVMIVDVVPEVMAKACDVICPHPYPSPVEYIDGTRLFGSGLDEIRSCLVRAKQANDGGKAVWLMPQVFSYGGATNRNPSFTELRWMMLEGIANGAKGMVPFIFCGYWNNLENRVASDAVFEELVLLEPFFTCRDAETSARADDPRIDVIAKVAPLGAGGKSHTAIVAVNRSYQQCNTRIAIGSLGKNINHVLVLRENRVVPVVNGGFSDSFTGLGSHVYTTVEALPALKSIDELEELIAAPQRAAAASGNLLAAHSVCWSIDNNGCVFSQGEKGTPFADRGFTSGLRDGHAWFPMGSAPRECVLSFETRVSFSRLVLRSSTIRDADLDVWDGDGWKTIHRWCGQLLPVLEWSGSTVTATRLRIRPTAVRQGMGPKDLIPEISELGIFP